MKIAKLPQEIINQIAAGEVVERPASVVKELIDNSIDAEAQKIQIRLKEGGIKLIEVQDDGLGIPHDQLLTAFEPHTTSKIRDIEDLNSLMTMGFRGEALATIQSVSETIAISKAKGADFAYKIELKPNEKPSDPKKTAHPNGTTIMIANLFGNIPARKKYLRTPATEYRHILKTLMSYFLIHPEIHFILEKDRKQVINLPVIAESNPETLHPDRVNQVLKKDWTQDMIDFFYDGSGIKVGGLAAHPKYHSKRGGHEYIYINSRPIYDRGIVKSVLQGFSRYIPHGEKVPFLISLKMNSELVDVNVHPRKEEIRFINPYRVFHAVEQAVQKALQREVSLKDISDSAYSASDSETEVGFTRLRTRAGTGEGKVPLGQNDSAQRDFQSHFHDSGSGSITYGKTSSGKLREVKFNKKPKRFEVQRSLKFSEGALQKISDDLPSNLSSLKQIFNKYLIAEFEDEIWVIDQHAAAERITFEHLQNSLKEEISNTQRLLVPENGNFSPDEVEFLKENSEFFSKIGFELKFEKGSVQICSVPADLSGSDPQKIFNEIFEGAEDISDADVSSTETQNDIIATISCHTSIRSGQSLHHDQMLDLIKSLISCENPYSCPHGRPVVWKLKLSEIDKHFERTY